MIYIVEDDPAIRELEEYALKSADDGVTAFADADPFWQAMAQHTPDLVILDIMLPGEDGKHIAQIHHAELQLESTLGKGTSITVRFPA